ncbi:MAG: PadR family transcriptional regulator [Candidatus Micrarchaeota archaeon]
MAKAPASSPIKRLRNLLTSGNLWLYILSLIKRDGKLYAYALDEEIEKEFTFRPNKIMIYVVLYKLEGEGLITSKFEERRKYYSITPRGKETLDSARSYFKTLAGKL